jgi:hypothetical protein
MDEEFDDLLLERDPFKLAIRGLAAVEAEMNAAIVEEFGGDLPSEIRNTRFAVRLALAAGLKIIPPNMRGLFDRLASIRNAFAHGEIDHLTPQRARPAPCARSRGDGTRESGNAVEFRARRPYTRRCQPFTWRGYESPRSS